ncbi:TadE/TadG family type IV pilus assembly protein [Burkholderia anthina]|uniref:TadE/TadG family type IV pilus assembly protein n=1 Tax=Burkholderia anthina TaxID=179879 RepID=UPI00158D1A47|nr:TadE/TadG family type IV pilus assembly protein [Burkholderia anthina]
MKRAWRPRGGQRQHGATAVEFAIVFPLFFLVFYGIISFGMIFVIQQSLTYAASEGARAGLVYASTLGSGLGSSGASGSASVSCTSASVSTTRTQNACNTSLGALGWLTGNAQQLAVVVTTPSCGSLFNNNSTSTCLTVTISYSPQQWMTTMPLLVGKVLNGPLTSTAVVQIPLSMQ